MIKVVIELDSHWVLAHRDREDLPIDVLVQYLKKSEKYTITDTTLTCIEYLCLDEKLVAERIENEMRDVLKKQYHERVGKVVTVTIEDYQETPEDIAEEEMEEPLDMSAADETLKVYETAAILRAYMDMMKSENADMTLDEIRQRLHDYRRKIITAVEEADGTGVELDDSGLCMIEESYLKELEERRERANKPKGKSSKNSNEGSDDPEEPDPSEEQERALNKIDELVGAAEFKALAHEIDNIADEIKRTNTYEVFANQCYLFSIGDGCGLNTYLELFAELIADTQLCGDLAPRICEARLGVFKEDFDSFGEAVKVFESGGRRIKIFCVDISEWMDRTDNRFFKQFLRIVEKNAKEFIVVFRVPFVDKDVLARIKYSLSDLLSVKAVSFPPLSQDEIRLCAQEELNKFSFTVSGTAWKYFFERISEEKSDGKFYGVNTVKKVVRELVYQKHLENAKKEAKSNQITVNNTKALCYNINNSNLTGEEQLAKLVGVDSIKKRMDEIIAQIMLSLKGDKMQRPCVHMRFVGNPGTGKTTVARIIGKILKEKGVLSVGAFFEYGGRDFCGRYIGETAPKTASICRDAYGSVLFIDEAYSLYRGDDDSRDFGKEALDTLIAEMENHRSDFVVIMAGYTDDMEKLMKGNAGLASRMPYIIEFPNFTREQLYDIFVAMVKERFEYDEELFEVAREFFEGLSEEMITSKEFSNARYVRNLFERTWAKAAMRCQLGGIENIVLTRDDFEHASADKEFIATSKKARMGF